MLILADLKNLLMELCQRRDQLQEIEVKIIRTMKAEQKVLLGRRELQLATV
jgi:hypothetical protein